MERHNEGKCWNSGLSPGANVRSEKEQSVLRMQHLNWLPTGNMFNKDQKKASKQAKLLNIANKFRASHFVTLY